ncbi:MAG: hypothetical protein E4G94_04635 [ANME-2 cluster archaeon]|nr:MAG: hypothetical protein E4G94_04635 [ANME-2 cluster archaeon]
MESQGIYDNRFIESNIQINKLIRKYDSKIMLQIVHGNRQALVTHKYPIISCKGFMVWKDTG